MTHWTIIFRSINLNSRIPKFPFEYQVYMNCYMDFQFNFFKLFIKFQVNLTLLNLISFLYRQKINHFLFHANTNLTSTWIRHTTETDRRTSTMMTKLRQYIFLSFFLSPYSLRFCQIKYDDLKIINQAQIFFFVESSNSLENLEIFGFSRKNPCHWILRRTWNLWVLRKTRITGNLEILLKEWIQIWKLIYHDLLQFGFF